MSADLNFPILETSRQLTSGLPTFVPWSIVAPHEKQAQANHSQTLRRLAERGGLAWSELEDVLLDRPWDGRMFMLPRQKEEYAAHELAAAKRVLALIESEIAGVAPTRGSIPLTLTILLALWLLCGPALAQGARVFSSFFLSARAPDLAVTTTSARVALGAASSVAWTCNVGSAIAYVALGDATIVATVPAGFPILASQCVAINVTAVTYMAAITSSGTATLLISMGEGHP